MKTKHALHTTCMVLFLFPSLAGVQASTNLQTMGIPAGSLRLPTNPSRAQ
jgi:hypothetical protein